jgi:hypothetical protein
LGRVMSSRGRRNQPVGSLIFSSAEAPAIRGKCCLDRRGSHFAATHFVRSWHIATFRCDASTRYWGHSGQRERTGVTRLAQSGHRLSNFALTPNAAFRCVGNATCPEELRRLHHSKSCVSPRPSSMRGTRLARGHHAARVPSKHRVRRGGSCRCAVALNGERPERIRQHTAA